MNYSTYLVTDNAQIVAAGHSLGQVISQAVAGGVTCIQVRSKNATAQELLRDLRVVCAAARDVPVLINDRVDVFCAAQDEGLPVAGVHLGQQDLPVTTARRLIGDTAILGLSANTPETISAANTHAALIDYLGCGPIHHTSTKQSARQPLGRDGFAHLVALAKLPVVAIGGVTAADSADLWRVGAAGLAVVSAICAAADPHAAARTLAVSWPGGVRPDVRND